MKDLETLGNNVKVTTAGDQRLKTVTTIILTTLTAAGIVLFYKMYKQLRTNCANLQGDQKKQCKAKAKLVAAKVARNRKGSKKG